MFVPVPTPPPAAPTREAAELADYLREAIAMYHAQHPGLRADDVRQALRLAATDGEGTDSRVAIVLVAGLVALLVAGLLAFGGTTSVPPIGSLVGGGGVLAVAIALIKRQRP